MNKRERSGTFTERGKSIIRHVERQNPNFSASQCVFHFDRPCFTLLNNFNSERFHCLYSNQSVQWRWYSVTKSCDVPEHFYDLMVLNRQLGSEYVLPFAGHFRESSGYTVGMFRQDVHLYPPTKIERSLFKETVYAMIVFLCAVCHRLGGNPPNVKHFSFVYSVYHPVLCDVGAPNAENRERLAYREDHFNNKKWKRFMCRKTTRDVIRYLRVVFPHFFQKKRVGKQCILNEGEDRFDDETHRLVCRENKNSLLRILKEYKHLMPDTNIRNGVVNDWIVSLERDSED